MTPIADMVRKLFEKGVDHDAILIAIEAAEHAMRATVSTGHPVDEMAEKRRAWDRERKRAARACPVESPPENAEVHRTSVSAPLSKERKNEGSKEEREATKAAVHRTRGHRLPDDWQPEDWAKACTLLGEARAIGELEKFRDHWKQQAGARGVKLDWNAAFRNWARRALEFAGGHNGKTPRGGSAIDAWDRLAAKTDEVDRDTGQDAFEFLPPRSIPRP